jgi:hypothetical protein
MEHASLAAFARFSLELLAVGAPADLLAEATAAMEDERRHALLCFSAASAYAGSPLEPCELSLDGCAPAGDLASIVETTFLEGCIGETVAALEAREVARATEDPALGDIMARIAEDETRHAALAWRLVRWALGRDPATVRAVVDRLARGVSNELRGSTSETVDDAGAEYGLVSAARSRATRARALRDVVLPCVAALGGGRPTSRADGVALG